MKVTKQELLDVAIDTILELDGEDCFICERIANDECSVGCNSPATRECVLRYLEKEARYRKSPGGRLLNAIFGDNKKD